MVNDGLCSQCRNIPFQKIFTSPLASTRGKEWGIHIGTLRDLWVRDGCAFCTLVKLTFISYYGGEYLESQITRESGCELLVSQSPIDLRDEVSSPRSPDVEKVPHYLEIHTSRPTLERVGRDMAEFSTAWMVPKIHLITEGNEVGSRFSTLHGRRVSPGAIDWAYAAKWLKTCQSRHPEIQVGQSNHGRGTESDKLSDPVRSLEAIKILVIDVHRLCVVPMPLEEKYIALSYMWGKDQPIKLMKENIEQLHTPGIFNSIGPSRTIVDAMEATRQLGYRYIWVDALCITQDDEQTILANVGVMDLIYTKATLTIVAAAGNDADSGLPGVFSDIRRTQRQNSLEIHGLVVANMLDSHNDSINYSTWNTRGWTYQERILSSRLLIFTDAQVYYMCSQECEFREDLHLDDGSAIMTPPDPRYQLDLENENLFDIYANAVAEYTYRKLTNGDDKLRAFSGFLNILLEPFRGPFFFGLPATVFDVGLLWIPVGACSRSNKKFPSWSWAGWDGPVRYAMRDSMANLCECTVSQVDIETSCNVQLCSRVDRLSQRRTCSSGGKVETWSRHINEETLAIYYSLTDEQGKGHPHSYPRCLSTFGKEDAQKLVDSEPGLLKITGLTACFLINGQHSRLHKLFSTCRDGRHEQCNLAVVDDQDRVAGTVFIDGRLVPKLCPKVYRFLAVARSTLSRMDDDASWDDETRSFRCWTHPESGRKEELDDDDKSLINEVGINIVGREAFDVKEFNDRVFWPVFDVLLLEEQSDGTMERLGIGKIHVGAFLAIAKESCVLLC